MWEEYTNQFHKTIDVNLEKSIYCGDAAGRVNGKIKDFSDSDLYIINIIKGNLQSILDSHSGLQNNSSYRKI